jgi:hypothetical protein
MRTEILAADRGYLCRAYNANGNLYAEIWGECRLQGQGCRVRLSRCRRPVKGGGRFRGPLRVTTSGPASSPGTAPSSPPATAGTEAEAMAALTEDLRRLGRKPE